MTIFDWRARHLLRRHYILLKQSTRSASSDLNKYHNLLFMCEILYSVVPTIKEGTHLAPIVFTTSLGSALLWSCSTISLVLPPSPFSPLFLSFLNIKIIIRRGLLFIFDSNTFHGKFLMIMWPPHGKSTVCAFSMNSKGVNYYCRPCFCTFHRIYFHLKTII